MNKTMKSKISISMSGTQYVRHLWSCLKCCHETTPKLWQFLQWSRSLSRYECVFDHFNHLFCQGGHFDSIVTGICICWYCTRHGIWVAHARMLTCHPFNFVRQIYKLSTQICNIQNKNQTMERTPLLVILDNL